jgi:hypothetical protein
MRCQGSNDQLLRLQAAAMLFVRQQCERAMRGEDWEDLNDENLEVVKKVLPILEEALDEDHVDQLDAVQIPPFPGMFMPGMFRPGMFRFPGFPGFPFPFARARRHHGAKGDGNVCEIVGEFREDLDAKVRKARRQDRGLTEEELDELVAHLREELAGVVKRAPRGRKSKAAEEA